MRMRAYKTKLRATRTQREYFNGCAGAARFVFNWALADRKQAYEERGETVSKFEQKKRFNALKPEAYPWLADYPYTLVSEEFDNVDRAYQNFFRRVKNGEKEKGFPKFKNRHTSAKKFTLRGSIRVEGNRVKLPRIGWVTLAERDYVPELTSDVSEYGRILFVTISYRSGDWYISFQVEEPEPTEMPQLSDAVLGVDLGVKSLAVVSDGAVFNNPKTLAKYEKKLARLQRELSRRQKGSANRAKTKAKIAKLHKKIADTRAHTLHDISAHVTANSLPKAVVLETLNVKGMVKNRSLAKAVSDAGMSELGRQIDYKAKWLAIDVLCADRWYPSSKTCSGCGYVNKELTLSDRTYDCPQCGLKMDRDMNAAVNLAALYEPLKRGGLPVELDKVLSTVKQEAGTGQSDRTSSAARQRVAHPNT